MFLNLEKTNATQGTVKKLEIDDKEIDNSVETNKELERFSENLFKRKLRKTKHAYNEFLRDISPPTLSLEKKQVCDEQISEQEVILAIKSFSNNKFPGNDGLTKELYETFWEELKQHFMNSLNLAKVSKTLVTSQRQAVIKLLEKKDKDKRLISNWRPISLLNVDYKIISKVFVSIFKKVLPNLIPSQQTAHVAQRCINESRRLTSDLLSVTKKNEGKMTNDIEKAFDSLDHTFLISALEKFGFGETFIDWKKIFLNKQESCVINRGITTKYFKLEKGEWQGNLVSAYLFILYVNKKQKY